MKKIKVLLHVSLDGYVGGPKGEMDWIQVSDDMFDRADELTSTSDLYLMGRNTFDMMEAYWPTAADGPTPSDHAKHHSAWYKSVDKFVLSRTRKGQKVGNTTFIDGDIARIKELKQKQGKDIVIFGSPSVIRLLMKENLIDDYWLMVNPVILGGGISMFANFDPMIRLNREETLSLPGGVTALHFSKK